jgi:hypothetical protein
MSLINAAKIEDIYKIFKENYSFDIAECIVKEVSIAFFDDVKKIIAKPDKMFSWDFALNYMNRCNKCYHIKYRTMNFLILMIGNISRKRREHVCKSIYRTYLTAKLYDIQKELKYYIILNPMKRKLPCNGDKIEAKHINGGFTYIRSNEIYIIRAEDYEKVILHELLHHNKLIHHESWKQSNLSLLKKVCNMSKDFVLIPNEAIVETFACVLNIVFYSIESGKSFKRLLLLDIKHNLSLVNKIFTLQGDKEWREQTNSYCYIVYKTIFYAHFNEFLKIYKYKNDDDITRFIIAYFPRIKTRVNRLGRIPKNNSLKQTVIPMTI